MISRDQKPSSSAAFAQKFPFAISISHPFYELNTWHEIKKLDLFCLKEDSTLVNTGRIKPSDVRETSPNLISHRRLQSRFHHLAFRQRGKQLPLTEQEM